LDSALKYFNWIVENHPNSPQYKNANERIQTLQYVLSNLNEAPVDSSHLQEDN
jgi:hypothetical protein